MRISIGFVVGLAFVVSFSAQAVEVEGFDNGPPCTGGGLLWDSTAATWGSQQLWTLGRASDPIAADDCYARATYTPLTGGGESCAGKGFAVTPSTSYTVAFYARMRPDRVWGGGTCWFEVDWAWGNFDSAWVRDGGAVTIVQKWIDTDVFPITWAQYSDTTADSGSNTFITLALKAGSGGGTSIPHVDHLDLEPIVSVYDWSVY